MNLNEYSYNSIFKNKFAPKPGVHKISWYVSPKEIKKQNTPVIPEENKIEEVKENITDIQPVFNVIDITPKRSFFRRK